jgi:Sigma-70, region 4
LARAVYADANDRRANIVTRFAGFDGTGRKTLEEVGNKFGITRERVRQIVADFKKRAGRRRIQIPVFRRACALIESNVPSTESRIREKLRSQHITAVDFDCTGILATLALLGEQPFFRKGTVGNTDFLGAPHMLELLQRIPRICGAIVSAFGCGHIEHILSDLEIGSDQDTAKDAVVTVLETLPAIRWLNPGKEWFTIADAKRNRLANVVRKILCVSQTTLLSELRAAIKREYRLDGFAPPRKVLKEFCDTLPFCRAEGEHVIAVAPLPISDNLGQVEQCFHKIFLRHGPVMSLSAFRDECLQCGMNTNTFYKYLTYSPIVCRLAREVYSLVGAKIPPGTVEETATQIDRRPTIVDSGWNDSGHLWIAYRLNIVNQRTGVFTVPASFRGMVVGQFFVQSSGTGSRNVISVEGDRLLGLHRPLAMRGGEPGDTVTVTFDLQRQAAEISLREDVVPTVEVVQTSITGSKPAVSYDKSRSGVSESLSDQEWQPVSTAPANRDLEVRLEDSAGRYALMFPCRLVPEQGWINSWLQTPLAVDPVDWREWLEPPIEF